MSENVDRQGRSLRFAAPALYKNMIDTFENHHIHPFDVQAVAIKKENGFDITLTFTNTFSKSIDTYFSFEQAENPKDKEVTEYFNGIAVECKDHLIKAYFKMMKP